MTIPSQHPSLRSPLTVLQHGAGTFSSLPAFRVADRDGWRDISYAACHADVELVARFWAAELRDLPPRAVVSVWLGGTTYADFVHSYAIARAGFVPQFLSASLQPAAALALMTCAGAAALVYDASDAPAECTVPAFPACSPDAVPERGGELPPLCTAGQETFCIFHTSGSTGAMPKLVPCTFEWMDGAVGKSQFLCRRRDPARQDVTNIMSSGMHMAQSFLLLGVLANGGCNIAPRSIPFSPEELLTMVRDAGLTILRTFGTFLGTYVREPQALAALKTLDEVCYSGIALPEVEVAVARAHGVKLRDVFGSTELGALMYSPDGETALVPLPGPKYDFRSLQAEEEEENGDGEAGEERLLELVVQQDSLDRPVAALCDAQGEFRTGDLFQRVGPDKYEYRGRADDWIKTLFAARVDTRAIEEQVRTTCADLVQDCVVVGWRRPAPVLVVEPRGDAAEGEQKYKESIISRIAPFDALRHTHERISEARLIVVAAKGALPRTTIKGNIRRQAVEEQFKDALDAIFG